ncbi:hypothetical protein BBO99_00002630 [Phytophthora kernoviae]|uniref:RxLR effector protein n=2 Tax=Phytophthora kernoviae TaxID=325452 RepID=A0A3R7KM62_9STRA|nr:hypothetical protein G195_011382 [Phytophthora kernoviae 00238/432]KAG2507389.1 hypothetical protein JM18_009282 [Phytophthora kernoviae]RLN14132.1 hypothetical protein BBI17_002574 [Phytophthora kernoviae]RLN82790.1 hypothetical protein BBO99_00002630 [Phytophthora kernoviae]
MRLSHVLVAIAATFVVTSEASSSITGSISAETSRVAVSGGPSQRMLRTHHTTYEDDEDEEERGLRFKTSLNGYDAFLQTPEYMKYRAYLNYLRSKKKK